MKNLYLFTFIFLLGTENIFAQALQNANWYFGNRVGITFNTAPPTGLPTLPTSVAFMPVEGCATISDNSGNVLFFTDGETVWRPTSTGYQIIASGLYGDTSSTQNAIIVHKPGDPDNYYIFTIRGITSPSANRGLYYSEIEVTPSSETVIFQNHPLNDIVKARINSGWGNISEAITCTKHSDNYQYWVEAFVGKSTGSGHLLSYLVTDQGIIEDSPSSEFIFTPEAFAHCLKINNDKIAVGTGNNGAYLGTFSNTTGIVEMSVTAPIGSLSGQAYSLEFSPSGAYLYFTIDTSTYLNYVNVATPSTLYTLTSVQYPTALQLGMNGKIYLITNYSNTALSSIGAPDIPATPDFTLDAVSFGGGAYTSELGLPQLISIQPWDGPCQNIVEVSDDVVAPSQDNQQASNLLYAYNTIESGSKGVYHAGNAVVLQDGFHAENNSEFRAYILGCSGTYAGKMSGEAVAEAVQPNINDQKALIFPNPSTRLINIVADFKINNLWITTLDGKIVLTQNGLNASNYELNIENYQNGIYILIIETYEGKILTNKIVKN